MNTKLTIASITIAAAVGLMLAIGANMLAAPDAEAQARNAVIVRGSWVQASNSHNAEGHSGHQVVNFFSPEEGLVYNGKVTFTSTKGIDVIAYHDISEQSTNTTGLAVWKVAENTYATTTLMKNVTSGTIEFVGSGLLAHSPASDTYTVVFSADGYARRATQ